MNKVLFIVVLLLMTKFCIAQDSLAVTLTMDGIIEKYFIRKLDNMVFVLKSDKKHHITIESKSDTILFCLKKKERIMKCELPMHWLNGNELNLRVYKTKRIFYRKRDWLDAISGSHALSCEVTFERIN